MKLIWISQGERSTGALSLVFGCVFIAAAVLCIAWITATESGTHLFIPAGATIGFALTYHLEMSRRRGWRRFVPTTMEFAISLMLAGAIGILAGIGLWVGGESTNLTAVERPAFLKVGLTALTLGCAILCFEL
jgi:hypothetical protein